MSAWIIVSWVCVLVLTGINAFIFLKLKGATEQMMQMAFPGTKNMNEALAKMQGMMQGMNRGPQVGRPRTGRVGNSPRDTQLRAAMEMLQKLKK